MKIKNIYLIIILAIFLGGVAYLMFDVLVSEKDGFENEHVEGAVFEIGAEEKETIRELIITMSRNNPAVLAFKKGKLEALGVKLRHKVTTFEFLACVFSDPELASEMKLLQESSLKYNRFIEGLFPKMLKEYENEAFYTRATHFAKHLEIDEQEFVALLEGCISVAQEGDKSAFGPLLDYLISTKAK
jgi:hypothetical protein